MGGGGTHALRVMFLVAMISGCTSRDAEVQPAPRPGMQVENARARLTPAQVGAVYLTLVNATGREDRLLSATSTSAARVELHEVVPNGEVLQMLPRPEGFAIPASGRVELKPGGKHLMLYSVRASSPDIDLTLHFERTGELRLRVPVIPMVAEAP
jgi:copper(I)-binding protein